MLQCPAFVRGIFFVLPYFRCVNYWKRKDRIFITCSLYLTPYLKQEVEALGYSVLEEKVNGLELEGTPEDCIRLNLNLRTATRVLYHLHTGGCRDVDYLYKDVRRIDWDEYLDADSYFSVDSFAEHPAINNSMFVNLKVKDAIADYFMEKTQRRPDSGPEKTKALVYVFWKNYHLSIYLDTSGINLTKHGYRKLPFQAPLQENLAAGIILASGWKGQSTFINPMCGSGTLAIEAALIACHRSNGLLRDNYAFMHLKGYDPEVYDAYRKVISSEVQRELAFPILASDQDPEAIEAARKNARTAGVEHLIQFSVGDFAAIPIPEGPGVVMLNPPYGERLDEVENLVPLYQRIGQFLKHHCQGKTGYVFTGTPELMRSVGLKVKRKIKFMNAKIECRLLEYELYAGSKKQKATAV